MAANRSVHFLPTSSAPTNRASSARNPKTGDDVKRGSIVSSALQGIPCPARHMFSVASGILPDVEDGILPPGNGFEMKVTGRIANV